MPRKERVRFTHSSTMPLLCLWLLMNAALNEFVRKCRRAVEDSRFGGSFSARIGYENVL